MKPGADVVPIPAARSRATDFVALAKPRLNLLVVVSAVAGYVMANGDTHDVWRLVCMIVGTGLVAGGASAFNQIIEREPDALMQRTRLRPMPDGRLPTRDAWIFGTVLNIAGLVILALGANLLSAAVAFLTMASYAVVYTPLKRYSSFSTVIGAIPGALPPVIGWTAALDELSQGAWVLFGIVFLWQLPHFLAIAWIYREDYARAGFPMLPVIEPDGRSTARQAVVYALALLPVSLAPTLVGMTGPIYFAGALVLTLVFIALSLKFAATRSITGCPASLLRFDHLPAAAVDADDCGPDVVPGAGEHLRSARVRSHFSTQHSALPMLTIADLPALNATLNATAAILLVCGYLMIRQRRIETHRRFMLAAFATSALFLVSYLIYHANVGSRPFPGQGAIRTVYYTILITHVVLAAAILPLAIITLTHALRERFERHVPIARWTLPIWLYVSVTGVVVYLMLYQINY